MNKRNLRPINLGLVVGSREFFNGAPALQTRAELLKQLDRLNVASAILPVEATKNGDVQSREDARRYAAFFRDQREAIDGLVICLPNFGDEIAILELVNEARLNVPILLQASNDEIDKVDVKSRRDAFCGKFSVANNFYQYGVPFTDTTTHTSDVDGAEFAADLDRFVRICRVVRGLRRARIGSIGARTGSFKTMRFSEKLLQASELTVVTVDSPRSSSPPTPSPSTRRRSEPSSTKSRPTAAFPRTSSRTRSFARPSGRSRSIAGSRRTNATPAPSSAGAASRTISAAPAA